MTVTDGSKASENLQEYEGDEMNTTTMVDEHVIDYRNNAYHRRVCDTNKVLNNERGVSYYRK